MKFMDYIRLIGFVRKDEPVVLRVADRRGFVTPLMFSIVYGFVVTCVFFSLKESLFAIGFAKREHFASWFVELFTLTVPMLLLAIWIGLAPFLIGAVWCSENRFYIKMMECSFLKKLVFSACLFSFILFVVDIFIPTFFMRFLFSRFFIPLIPYLMVLAFMIRHVVCTKGFRRKKKETMDDWRERIGIETWGDFHDSILPSLFGFFSWFGVFVYALMLYCGG